MLALAQPTLFLGNFTSKEGDKLMKYGNTLYSEPPSFLQAWKRWFYSENQQTTFTYLNDYFIKLH